ncbi:MAG: hydrogenase 4 subunit F [Elusimicrobia bacterium]|nr:hydrogenase 4 subunit F [Candidatus Liberimonas magnetica]
MEAILILGIIVFLAIVPLFLKDARKIGILNSAGYFAVMVFALHLSLKLLKGTILFYNFFYLDSLSGFFILLTSIISFASSLYSIEYISADIDNNTISKKESRLYYALFNLFTFTMIFATTVNNVGIVWVSIEMTTLVSAFLVGFYGKEESVEAAWKYIIICSLGISLALLGIILLYYTVSTNGGIRSLNWTDMLAVAHKLDPKVLKIAFIFILVGYGTKAGIAPMHTWLPDAHSQALTPISALLSGVLLKTALYAILRFIMIINRPLGPDFSGNLLVFFGIFSLVIAAGFILVQKDIKRLLAYHSVEHIGIILFGLGIGGPLGLYGAMFHMFNHAVTKALMFFGAGNIVKKYKTHDMHLMNGIIESMPFTGFFVIAGAFALAGMPPFSIFFSEIIILISGFMKGSYISSLIYLLVIALIFGAIIYHIIKIVFGKKPDNMSIAKEPLSVKSAFIFLFIFIAFFGITMPAFFDKIINSTVEVLLKGF